jgi:hypothetical protein
MKDNERPKMYQKWVLKKILAKITEGVLFLSKSTPSVILLYFASKNYKTFNSTRWFWRLASSDCVLTSGCVLP